MRRVPSNPPAQPAGNEKHTDVSDGFRRGGNVPGLGLGDKKRTGSGAKAESERQTEESYNCRSKTNDIGGLFGWL